MKPLTVNREFPCNSMLFFSREPFGVPLLDQVVLHFCYACVAAWGLGMIGLRSGFRLVWSDVHCSGVRIGARRK